MPRTPVEPAAKPSAKKAAPKEDEFERGLRLQNDKVHEDVRGARIKNDAAELEHKRNSTAAATKHYNERRLAKTKQTQAQSEMEQHKVAHAKLMSGHDNNDRKIQTASKQAGHEHQLAMHQHELAKAADEAKLRQVKHASAQADLTHKRLTQAHGRSRMESDASWEDEKRERQRKEWDQHDEDRAHRYMHAAQLHHHMLREERRKAWTAVAAGLSGANLTGAMHKQVGGGH
jgi:hypothetical protein